MEKYKEYYKKLERLLGEREHRKIVIDGYMPLSIERLGKGEGDLEYISLVHYGEQNGDLMRDPEICFRVYPHDTGVEAVPCYFRNDYAGAVDEIPLGRRSPGLDELTSIWFRNLKEQGFFSVEAEATNE